MKKFFIFILLIIFYFQTNAMVIQGQMDDGFILNEGESQHQFILGMDALLFYNLHGAYQGINIFSIPFYNGITPIKGTTLITGSPMMLLPMVNLGYIARWHVLENFEINFNIFSSTPSPSLCIIMPNVYSWLVSNELSPFYKNPSTWFISPPSYFFFTNLFGFASSVGIGFKKGIIKGEDKSISYKFNLGIDYTGDAHGAISIKNSFLFGYKRPNSILSFNPFINSALKIGLATGYNGAWIVLEPGIEIVSKVVSKTNFCFTSTFMIGYEMDFLIMPTNYYVVGDAEYFYYAGKIVISSSFGLGRSGLPRKKLKNIEKI